MLTKKVKCAVCGASFEVDFKEKKEQYICLACQEKIDAEKQAKEEAKKVKKPVNGKIELFNKKNYASIDRSVFKNDLDFYVEVAYVTGASDIHLKAGSFPCLRRGGKLYKIEDKIITSDEIIQFVNSHKLVNLDHEISKSYDFSFGYKDVRFRSNLYHSVNGYNLALRLLKLISTDFSVLGVPEKLKELAEKKSGLILITGPTGSGKTTTLAALINHINNTSSEHIVTLEDPIEYLFENKMSIITQKEMRRDYLSFAGAIPELLREDPDIIMVGEMRDKESIEAALRAAETGHLVFSTLHTRGAVSTISRIIDIFPPDQQDQIRTQLSMVLLGVCSQQLLPSTVEGKRALATELMIATTSVTSSIRTKNLSMVANAVELGHRDGMYTMKSSLDKLKEEGKITEETYNMYVDLK